MKPAAVCNRSPIDPPAVWLLALLAVCGISKALTEIAATGAILMFLYFTFVRKLKPPPLVPVLSASLVFFFAGILISSAAAGDGRAVFRGILKWAEYLLIFRIAAAAFTGRSRAALWVFTGSMTLITLNGFYQMAAGTDFLRGISLDPGRILRMKSSLAAPNMLAVFYLLALPALFALAQEARPPVRRFLLIPLTGLFGAGFILTFSRSAFFALLTAAGAALAIKRRFGLIAAGTLLCAGILFSSAPMRHNFIHSIKASDLSLLERADSWRLALRLIKEHPVLGTGPNTYMREIDRMNVTARERVYPHNSYLHVWAETGAIGLAGLVSCLTVLLLVPARRAGLSTAILSLWTGLAAFCLAAALDNHFLSLQTAVLFWIFAGILASETLIRPQDGCISKPNPAGK